MDQNKLPSYVKIDVKIQNLDLKCPVSQLCVIGLH